MTNQLTDPRRRAVRLQPRRPAPQRLAAGETVGRSPVSISSASECRPSGTNDCNSSSLTITHNQTRVQACWHRRPLVVRWYEDPSDGYENDSIAGCARGAAAALYPELRCAGIRGGVQGVVVLWVDFDQRSIEQDKLACVKGDQLAAVLAARPARYRSELPNDT